MAVAGCTPNTSTPVSVSKGRPSNASSSLPIQATVDLGVIVQGESSSINQWVRNRSDKDVHAAKTEKSCECLDVRLSAKLVVSGCSWVGMK